MSAHTPGPWHIERSGGGWVREVTNKDGRAICYGSIEDADASLISAAPDMYEALTECICGLEVGLDAAQIVSTLGDGRCAAIRSALTQARAALAKARDQ